jgi:hypothetical protein
MEDNGNLARVPSSVRGASCPQRGTEGLLTFAWAADMTAMAIVANGHDNRDALSAHVESATQEVGRTRQAQHSADPDASLDYVSFKSYL